MPIKIIDQYSDLPINPTQKWRLRHPDRYVKTYVGYNNRKRGKKFLNNRKNAAARKVKENSSIVGEIRSLHARGKDLGNIAVWFNIPISKVREILND